MVDSLTPAQQIFSLFYAIFFGLMLQTIGSRRESPSKSTKSDITFNLFDTPNAWAIGLRWNNKPLRRFVFSIMCLNILPGFIFAKIFNLLHGLPNPLSEAQIVLILWISLVPHYIYRIFLAVLVRFRSLLYLSKKEFPLYNKHDLYAVALIKADRLKYAAHSRPVNHVAFPLFIIFPSYIIAILCLDPKTWELIRCSLMSVIYFRPFGCGL